MKFNTLPSGLLTSPVPLPRSRLGPESFVPGFDRQSDTSVSQRKALLTGLNGRQPHAKPRVRLPQATSSRPVPHPAILRSLYPGKGAVWSRLIRSQKISYLTLLRNLHEVLTEAPEVTDAALALLRNESLIRRSQVLPFRFLAALDAVQARGFSSSSTVQATLQAAMEHSLGNMPVLPGRTLLALDVSASMAGRSSRLGSLLAAALFKTSHTEIMLFSDDARYVSLNQHETALHLASQLQGARGPGSTHFHTIFHRAVGAYDRVIILSDLQGWVGHHAPLASYHRWKELHRCDPKVFSIDLTGYGPPQFPQSQVFTLAGFSDKTLETMKRLEADPGALSR